MAIESLKADWRSLDLPRRDAIDERVIECFESTHDLALPTSFRDYLLGVNGMECGRTDEQFLSFLALSKIHKLGWGVRGQDGVITILFAEFCIYSHYYVLRILPNGEELGVFAADGTNERMLTHSFAEFIERYMRDSSGVAHASL